MCNILKSIKKRMVNFFFYKPLSNCIATILFWVLVLLLIPLVCQGKFMLASILITAVSLFYLSIMFLLAKLNETLPDKTMSKTLSYIEFIASEIMDLIGWKDATDDLRKVQRKVDDVNEKVDTLSNLLIQYVLPELGISVEEEELPSAWVQCDILDRDVPFQIFSNKVASRFMSENIRTFADLVSCHENELLELPDLGNQTIERIRQLLAVVGLHLDMTIKEEDGAWYYLREDSTREISLEETDQTEEIDPS